MNLIYHNFPIIYPIVTMETPAQGYVRSVTRVAVSVLGVGRTAAWAALRVSSTCGKKAAASRRALRDTTTTLRTGPASPATPAAEHAQVRASTQQ